LNLPQGSQRKWEFVPDGQVSFVRLLLHFKMNGEHYLDDARAQFQKLREMAEKALGQVSDETFFAELSPVSNSLAVIVKHVAGNARSRWTDFLTADGEKPDRKRDTEFLVAPGDTRASLMERWEHGWHCLDEALGPLREPDLGRTVMIRAQPHTVVQAINRQLTHYAYHVGQIVYLARYFAGDAWKTLSIPRGKSEEFNRKMQDRNK